MIIEFAGIHRKTLNPCKKYQFSYHLGSECSELFVYMHKKQIPMQEWICMKCPQTSHVEGDQFSDQLVSILNMHELVQTVPEP